MRDRTISWMEGQILKLLTKRAVITSYLALSSLVLESVRSLREQSNLDIAVQNLISKRVVICQKDAGGLKTYSLTD